jgi:ankyrin repeat protein
MDSDRFDRLEALLSAKLDAQTQQVAELQKEVALLRTYGSAGKCRCVHCADNAASRCAIGASAQEQQEQQGQLQRCLSQHRAEAELPNVCPADQDAAVAVLPDVPASRRASRRGRAGRVAAGGPVVFVSHTWLRYRHPDSEALDKFKTLTSTLKRMVAGELAVRPGWMVDMLHGNEAKEFRCSASQLQRDLTEGYVFFDFMSIPQAPEAAEAQQRAIASLVSFVSDSRYFFVLAGGWTHEDGSQRDEMAWSDRGWCRMELAANVLSPSSKPMVVVRSPTAIESYPPGGQILREWLNHGIVGRGKFTVDDDRLKLAPHLQHLISARKAQALAEGDLEFFRMLHARTAALLGGTGIFPPEEPYTAWMAAMRFESVDDGKKSKSGLTPLFFAVVAGRKDLVAALLERNADIYARCQIEIPRIGFQKGFTVLGVASGLTDDAELVQMLIQHGADPKAPNDQYDDTCLVFAFGQSNCKVAQCLINHDPTLLDHRNNQGCLPILPVFMFGKLEAAKFVKEHYPEALTKLAQEPAQQWGSGVIASALGNNAGNLEVIEILLDAGEDIELCSKGHGKMGMLINFCDFARRFNFNKLQLSGMVMTFAYGARVPALSTAAFAGNLAALKLLLDRGADIHARGHNPRQLTALHFAAVRGHADVVAALLAAGARTDLKDKAGRTPADIAKQVGNHEIRQMLIGAAAEALAGSSQPVRGGAGEVRV